MKAIRYHQPGPPEVLVYEEVPKPTISPDQVLIKVRAASVNFADVGRRSGLFPTPPLPHIPGLEAAGIIEEVGSEVRGLDVGQRVIALQGGAAYAEYAVSSPETVIPLPETLSMEEGSSIGVTFQTAWHALKTRARVQPGETVVVQSAGSGVSVAAIQIAKYMGARVIATASTGEKAEKALALGADEAFNYLEKDFLEEVLRLTDDKGAEVILDPLSGPDFYQKVRALASWTGRIVVLGLTLGDVAKEVNMREMMYRHLSILGGPVQQTLTPEQRRQSFLDILDLMQQGKLKPYIQKVYPLQEAAQAHQAIEERNVFGKLVLQVS